MKKRGPQQRQKKILSATGLLGKLRVCFGEVLIPQHNLSKKARGRPRRISVQDCLMSGLAMFNLKYPSLLAFDQSRNTPEVMHNFETLFGIEQAPSDSYMREVLDMVPPTLLRKCFLSVFEEARKGKLLEQFRFMNGYLILTDGTQVFNSEDVHCENCCQKNHKDGRITYYHQILGAVIAHPNHRQVIPLCPEPITKKDGSKKNDCERNAMQRFLKDLKREHPKVRGTIVSDALSANTPQINGIIRHGYDYIVNVKPEGNRSLFEWMQGLSLREVAMTVESSKYKFSYINGVPLNSTEGAPEVNFLKCTVVELQGRKEVKKTFTWVTSHEITDQNVYLLMRGARARWKVENETFNTLKNQGYNFEHNYGHGKQNLHIVFTFLMMLAFLVDQIQEAACGIFQTALKHLKSRSRFWAKLRGLFDLYFVDSWEDIFHAMGPSFKGARIKFDSS